MEKALEILKELSNFRSGEIIVSIDFEIKIAEAIAELEKTMKPKTCEGCSFENAYSYQCEGICDKCLRNSEDRYEPKDNA